MSMVDIYACKLCGHVISVIRGELVPIDCNKVYSGGLKRGRKLRCGGKYVLTMSVNREVRP